MIGSLLPPSLVNSSPAEFWEEKLFTHYAKCAGLTALDAKWKYLSLARQIPMFGAETFVTQKHNTTTCDLIGILEDGILIFKVFWLSRFFFIFRFWLIELPSFAVPIGLRVHLLRL
jgi:hypothetical protein